MWVTVCPTFACAGACEERGSVCRSVGGRYIGRPNIRWPGAQGWGACCGRGSFVRCGRARSRSLPRPSHLSSTRGALAQLPPLARRDGALGGVRVHAPSSGAVYARRLALAARAARLVGGAELGALGGALRLPQPLLEQLTRRRAVRLELESTFLRTFCGPYCIN